MKRAMRRKSISLALQHYAEGMRKERRRGNHEPRRRWRRAVLIFLFYHVVLSIKML